MPHLKILTNIQLALTTLVSFPCAKLLQLNTAGVYVRIIYFVKLMFGA
jgi:hypothetical protein